MKAQEDSLKMNNLNVPDGFAYETTEDIDIDITLKGLDNAFHLYKLKGVDKEGNSVVIMQNFFPASGHLQTTLRLPLHYECILLEVHVDKVEHYFEWFRKHYIQETIILNNMKVIKTIN
jgi:hypothetical protein